MACGSTMRLVTVPFASRYWNRSCNNDCEVVMHVMEAHHHSSPLYQAVFDGLDQLPVIRICQVLVQSAHRELGSCQCMRFLHQVLGQLPVQLDCHPLVERFAKHLLLIEVTDPCPRQSPDVSIAQRPVWCHHDAYGVHGRVAERSDTRLF
jgi:hypothetical protein